MRNYQSFLLASSEFYGFKKMNSIKLLLISFITNTSSYPFVRTEK